MLGVSDARVRKLLAEGRLPGRHFGRVWIVPAAAVAELADRQRRAGRPLAPARAWALIDILDGGQSPWLERVARSQVRAALRRLAGGDARSWRAALRGREDRRGISGHRSAIDRLASSGGVWPAGPSVAQRAGADLVVVEAPLEFYVPPDRWEVLASELHLQPAVSEPDAFIRVPRALWPFGPDGPGPAALAATLVDSADGRSAQAGAELLNALALEGPM